MSKPSWEKRGPQKRVFFEVSPLKTLLGEEGSVKSSVRDPILYENEKSVKKSKNPFQQVKSRKKTLFMLFSSKKALGAGSSPTGTPEKSKTVKTAENP